MRVTTFGTRGSLPVAGRDHVKYGGRTTSLLVESVCVPTDTPLVVDAGTGIRPLARIALEDKSLSRVILLLTHHHHDHNQGLFQCAFTFNPGIDMNVYGPEEHKIGPARMFTDLMKPPYHPVNAPRQKAHFHFKGIEEPESMVMVLHPVGGQQLFKVDDFARIERSRARQWTKNGVRYSLDESMVISMMSSHHPELAFSYRIEERPTGKIFVFLTDHENTDGIPLDLLRHIEGANMLLMDSQYTRDFYVQRVGWGHSTPDHCTVLAKAANVPRIVLTHHDPDSSDEKIDEIVRMARCTAREIGYRGKISAAADDDVFQI